MSSEQFGHRASEHKIGFWLAGYWRKRVVDTPITQNCEPHRFGGGAFTLNGYSVTASAWHISVRILARFRCVHNFGGRPVTPLVFMLDQVEKLQ